MTWKKLDFQRPSATRSSTIASSDLRKTLGMSPESAHDALTSAWWSKANRRTSNELFIKY